MPIDLLHPDTARLVFVLGILGSILLYDRLHLTSGSLIAPAYVAMNLHQPIALGLTAVIAIGAWALVYRVLPRFVVLTGRDRFLVLIPISIVLHVMVAPIVSTLVPGQTHGADDVFMLGIGYVIPGLVAHDLAAQGFRSTALGIGVLGGALGAAGWITDIVLAPARAGGGPEMPPIELMFDPSLLPIAIGASVAASVALVRRHDVRAGGFVSSAYVALLLTEPVELIVVLVATGLTWAIVVRGLMPRSIVFGRRKFAAMLLVAALTSWIISAARTAILGGGPGPLEHGTLALIGVTLAGLYANDIHRAGLRAVGIGSAASLAFTAAFTLAIAEWRADGTTIESIGLGLIALSMGTAIAAPRRARFAEVGPGTGATASPIPVSRVTLASGILVRPLDAGRAALAGAAIAAGLALAVGIGSRLPTGRFVAHGVVAPAPLPGPPHRRAVLATDERSAPSPSAFPRIDGVTP